MLHKYDLIMPGVMQGPTQWCPMYGIHTMVPRMRQCTVDFIYVQYYFQHNLDSAKISDSHVEPFGQKFSYLTLLVYYRGRH